MNFVTANALSALALAVGILLTIGLGRRTGRLRLAGDPTGARSGLGAIEGAVYGLLGLVLAFSFSGAAERMLSRRAMVGEEINAVSTAYLRVDVLPAAAQPEIRELFRHYLEVRVEANRAVPDIARVEERMRAAAAVQEEIWARAIAATNGGTLAPASQLLLPALNEMIDMQTTTRVAMRQHPPDTIYIVLVVLMLITALFIGEGMAEAKRPSRLHSLGLAFTLAFMFFLIRDIERPLTGLIKIDDTRQLVGELRELMAK